MMKNAQWQISDFINLKNLEKELCDIYGSAFSGADDSVDAEREDHPEAEVDRGECRQLSLDCDKEEIIKCMNNNLTERFILSPDEMTDIFYSVVNYEKECDHRNIDDLEKLGVEKYFKQGIDPYKKMFELLFHEFIEQLKNQIAPIKTDVLRLSYVDIHPHDSEEFVTLSKFKCQIKLNRWLSCNLFLIENKNWAHIFGNAILCGQVEGIMSEESCTQIESSLKEIFNYLIGSIEMVSDGMLFCNEENPHFNYRFHRINSKILRENYEFIEQYIKLFFSQEENLSLDKRIGIAIRTLFIAFNQELKDIKIILSFTAMEALLSNRDSRIAETLGCNIATLLDPEVNNRKQHISNIKKLYGLRSDIIHGNEIDEKKVNEWSEMIYWLAFQCLKAVVHWKIYKGRLSMESEKKLLMDELTDTLYAGKKRLAGVSIESDYDWLGRINEKLNKSGKK